MDMGDGAQIVNNYADADIIYGWLPDRAPTEGGLRAAGAGRLPGDRPRLDAHLRPGERLPALHAAVLRRQAAAAPEERARNQAWDDLK